MYISIDRTKDINFYAIVANIGHCLSNTTENDFKNNAKKLGEDLAFWLSKHFEQHLASELFQSASKKVETHSLQESCIKNANELDYCTMGHLMNMLSALNYFSKENNLFFKPIQKLLDYKNLEIFYIEYFHLMKYIQKENFSYKEFVDEVFLSEFGFAYHKRS